MTEIALPDVYARLRNAIGLAGGETRFAQAHGLTPQLVNDTTCARRAPGPQILAALGLRKRTIFEEVRGSNG